MSLLDSLGSFIFGRKPPPPPPPPKPPILAAESETVVATATYETLFREDNTSTLHVVVFCARGSDRYVRIESSFPAFADGHKFIRKDRAEWKYHGLIPDYARRTRDKGKVSPFRVIDGGAA